MPTPAQKLDVYLSLDGSGSMAGQKWIDARQAIEDIVQDPDTGGAEIVYGYQEWGSSRTTDCNGPMIFVPLVNEVDATAAIVTQMSLGANPYGSTGQGPALLQLLDDYQNWVVPIDPEACRKRYVLMITDGAWNCGANACTVASLLGAEGIRIIVVALQVPVSAVQCLANASGGVVLEATNRSEIFSTVKAYLLNEIAAEPLGILPKVLPSPSLGIPYSESLTVLGGTGPYTLSVTAGTLPPGLSPLSNRRLVRQPHLRRLLRLHHRRHQLRRVRRQPTIPPGSIGGVPERPP